MARRRAAGRPKGEVSMALLSAASMGSGTVVQLAERACVGYDVARFKASALVRSGALIALTDKRPRVLAAAAAGIGGPPALSRSFGKVAAWFDVLDLAPDLAADLRPGEEGGGMT